MLATDKDGDISWKSVQESFGAVNALQHQSRISMNLRFPGQYYDQETGTHYNFHRDYKPNAGRYVQSDPIGLNGGVNTYSYVGSSPVFSSDPYGLKEVTGEWIKDPKLNVVDYGFSGFELVSPSWSWWGYVQFIRLHGYANGFVNIDVLCKEINDCGESTWEIHNKIYFSAVGHKDFGPNAYILGVGLVTNFFVGVSLNILLGGYAILQAGADALSNLNDQALQVLRVAYVNGPTAYCVGG